MQFEVVQGDPTKIQSDALVVGVFEGDDQLTGAATAVDRALGGAVAQLVSTGDIKGKFNQSTLIHTFGRIPSARVLVVGLGKPAELNADRLRVLSADAGKYLRRLNYQKIATTMHEIAGQSLGTEIAAEAVVEGLVLGLYRFREYITKEPEYPGIKEAILIEVDASKLPLVRAAAHKGQVIAEATNLARDMANEPSNHMTPSDMADRAKKVAGECGLELTVLERNQMEELGMGALLAVAQGSANPPKMMILRYRGVVGRDGKSLGLVGKGITFDSGGISIKPAEGLEQMKGDMAGGAAVIAAMQGIAQLKPKIDVTAVIPAAENMPSGTAYRPGDVLKSMSGKTIEVISTDAEGRLILADALAYIRRLGVSPLVDVATLTGACHVALGSICSGAFGNDQELVDRVVQVGTAAGDKIWPMPMYDEYKEQNKSDVADVKNTGGRYGGAITAALFLANFVDDTPWVHLDIAGTSRSDKDKGYNVKGATGVPTRTLINLALTMAEK